MKRIDWPGFPSQGPASKELWPGTQVRDGGQGQGNILRPGVVSIEANGWPDIKTAPAVAHPEEDFECGVEEVVPFDLTAEPLSPTESTGAQQTP